MQVIHGCLGAAWAFGNETAVHALRLMGSGLFDEYPRLSIVLGHMGENIPFGLWRLDNCNTGCRQDRRQKAARKTIAEYFCSQFLRDDIRQLQHPMR